LCRHLLLWEKRVRRKDGEEGYDKIGLGLKDIIKKYGFGWLAKYMFNWEANTSAAGFADQFSFPIRQLERRYQARGEWKATREALHEMDQ
jgi:hypothetical protein